VTVLELTDLAKAYEGFEFGPVNLTVDEEVLAVLGPSGSGKTTLLSLVAGITTPDEGEIRLDGRAIHEQSVEERPTGLVFQDGALFPHMTARENVAYAATDPERVADLATRLEITDVLDRRPPTLSGGECQRVALARTLATDPEVLLLDEPLSSLDAPIRRRLRRELHDVFDALDIPVLYVTHDQRTATALGDRIAIVRDGRVAQVDAPATVLERPATRFVATFTGTENLFEATVTGRSDGTTALRVGDVTLRAESDEAHTPGAAVTACVPPSRVELCAPGSEGPENALAGTVRRSLNEGSAHRVGVAVAGAPVTVTATVRPPEVDRLALEPGRAARVVVPPGAIHLLE
jgi:molybdate/tungstate transport system ATP-binding protein